MSFKQIPLKFDNEPCFGKRRVISNSNLMSIRKDIKLEEDSNSDKSLNSFESFGSKDDIKENKNKSPDIEVHDSFDEESEDSLNEDEDYKKLKEELDRANNFIDYFLVIGVEPDIYKNDWLYENNLNDLNKNYIEQLEPKILSSFPPFVKQTISFDESILEHCFPNGFKIIRSETQPRPKVFSFILDNNYYNLNYPQKYLTCLIFYENIAQYKLLEEQERILYDEEADENKGKNDDNIYINSLSNIDKVLTSIKYHDIYIPKCLLIMSLKPFFGEYEKILTQIYNYSLGIINDIENENNNFNQAATFKNQSTIKKINKRKEIYDPLDKIIENLLIELPVPPRGISTLEYTLNNEKRLIKQTKMNELPVININLKRLFTDYSVKDIITIYNYLFLEGRILFFSKNIEILNIYIHGFLALLYPFQYQYQIVTILPEKNFEIMESITPFIAGINQSYESNFFEKKGFTLSDSILIVDIDYYKLEIFNEITELPEFPKSPKGKLEKGLNSVVNKYLKGEKAKKTKVLANIETNSFLNRSNAISLENYKLANYEQNYDNCIFIEANDNLSNFQIDYDFNREVHELFFNFNANLLPNYSKFLNTDFYSSNVMPCLEILFKVNDYLKEIQNENEKEFYEKFISETQIFGDFLYLRMIPKNTKEKLRILLFDEKINQNSASLFSKSPPLIFTNSKEYEFVDKFEIPKPRKLTENEMKYLKKHKLNLLSFGIIINDNQNNNGITFIYPIFPKLTTKLFFQQTFHEYYIPNNWNEQIESINEDLISKSHLGGISIRQNDMQNYIYLCWMQMWAMTFWYCDEIEQNYRFQTLLEVLKEASCNEMGIFNILFEAISKYGKNDNFILKLYAHLLNLHLNPSQKVHKIVMQIIEKKNLEGNFNEKLISILENEKNIIYNKKGFRKRVIKSKYFPTVLSESIVFYAFDTCLLCQSSINLESISKNFKGITRNLEWTKCPNCKHPVLPKILIQFGKEINKTGEMKKNTSRFENIVLFSPYGLKSNYNSTLLKNFGVKLDLEELMLKYGAIFWDSLWYFKLYQLEYDFMLPYETKSAFEDISNLEIQKGKSGIIIKHHHPIYSHNAFNLNDLEIERYQLTFYKSVRPAKSVQNNI